MTPTLRGRRNEGSSPSDDEPDPGLSRERNFSEGLALFVNRVIIAIASLRRHDWPAQRATG